MCAYDHCVAIAQAPESQSPEKTTMTRLERNVSLASIVIPALAFLVAVVLLWDRAVICLER